MIGQEVKCFFVYLLLIFVHYLLQRGAVACVDLDVEQIFVDLFGPGPSEGWRDFLLQFFFYVFGENFLLRVLQ